MSIEYDQYLQQHKENVGKGLDWLRANLPLILLPGPDYEWRIKMAHDESKSKPDEYQAYDAYFYGKNRSFQVVSDFNKAWLLHIHRNPHHWQYWVLINDDPNAGTITIPMDYEYIIEMICDWWTFSWADGDLTEIFTWYAEDKGVKWVKGFEVIGANTVNKDYYERLLKEKNENGIGLHEDNIEEIERKKRLLHIRHITEKIYHYQDTTKQRYTQMIRDNYYGYTPKIKERNG